MKKKEITKENLLMFIQMTVLGLKVNPKFPKLGDEIEKLFNETFKENLV